MYENNEGDRLMDSVLSIIAIRKCFVDIKNNDFMHLIHNLSYVNTDSAVKILSLTVINFIII